MAFVLYELVPFLGCLGLGAVSRWWLLRLFIYTFPFTAGNLLWTVNVPVNIGRCAAFAIIFHAAVGNTKLSSIASVAWSRILPVLGMILVITIGGYCWIEADPLNVSLWSQTPLERAGRSLLREFLFWLLPLAFLVTLKTASECKTLIRDFVVAGLFYCGLGLLQFAVYSGTGLDLFPMIRGSLSDGGMVLQSVAGSAAEGRITSICGEPRYLSTLCAVWLVATMICGSLIGLPALGVALAAAVFLITNLLSGSRTGIAQFCMIVFAITLVGLWNTRAGFTRRSIQMLICFGIGFGVALLVGDLTITKRLDSRQDAVTEKIEVMGFAVPLEYNDTASLKLLMRQPGAIVTGFGAGLWQYQVNPSESAIIRQNFFAAGTTALDSLRQNVTVLAYFINYGLIGIIMSAGIYSRMFSVATRGSLVAAGGKLRPSIALLVSTAVAQSSDIGCNVMTFVCIAWCYYSLRDVNSSSYCALTHLSVGSVGSVFREHTASHA